MLTVGDWAYLRLAPAPGTEYAGAVVATDGTRCMLTLPQAFWCVRG